MTAHQTNSISKLIHFGHLVLIKVRLNLRSEAAKTRLSYAWWILEPILHMAVFYVVFKILLQRGTDDFVPFLLCGLVPWLWFSKSVQNSCQSIIQGKGLISQTFIPKVFFPLVAISQDAVKQSVVFLILAVFIITYGYPLSINWLWLIPIIITQLLLIMSVSFFVAFIVPFAFDFKYLVSTILILGMLVSGVFYSYQQVLVPEHRELFLLNPMANLIVNYRLVLLDGQAPMVPSLVSICCVSLALIVLVYFLMRRFDNYLTRLIVE